MTSSDTTELCTQCAEEMGCIVSNTELAYLVTKAQSEEGLYAKVYCEECGLTIVNHIGECVSKCCTKRHGDY